MYTELSICLTLFVWTHTCKELVQSTTDDIRFPRDSNESNELLKLLQDVVKQKDIALESVSVLDYTGCSGSSHWSQMLKNGGFPMLHISSMATLPSVFQHTSTWFIVLVCHSPLMM